MIETENTAINVEDLMRRIREEVARHKARVPHPKISAVPSVPSAVGATAKLSPYPHAAVSLPRAPESDGCIVHKPEYNLADFLNYHGEDFIRNAYRGILRREPDADGFAQHLNKLLSGQSSKVEILGRLRYSPEGKINAVPIRGLLRPFILQKICRIPVLGYGVALSKFIVRLPVIISNREQFESFVLLKQQEQVRNLNMLAAHVEKAFASMQQSLETEINNLFDLEKHKADTAQLDAMATRLGEVVAQYEEKLTDLTQKLATKADATTTQRETREIQRQMIDQQRRLAMLLEEARKHLPEPISIEQINNMVSEEEHLLDAFYVSFEDRFRGTRVEIKQRLRIYLPIIKEAKAGTKGAPILDIGCGRGELLELLKENDLDARGIDLNRVMVSQCQALGLAVVEAEAIAYLRSIEASSLGAVTGIHIIEHIPFKLLVALFDEVMRVLKPGGVAIFETPNPENLIVGACNFYYDPTHLNPLPPEPMRFILEARGYNHIEILRLHPKAEEASLAGGEMSQSLNNLLFGPQDYALIAYKS